MITKILPLPKKTISLIITMQSHLCNQLFAALAII